MGDQASFFNGDTRYIPVIHLNEDKLNEELHYQIAKKFINVFHGFLSKESEEFLSYSLTELMDNVFHHAKSAHGLWLHLQKYPYFNSIELCICDLGIGISESMKENSAFSSYSDFDRFLLALETGNTSKPDFHSGEGLSSSLNWISYNPDAAGVLFSKKHWWVKPKNKKPIANEHTQIIWPGTFIWLSIPRSPKYSLQKIWENFGLYQE